MKRAIISLTVGAALVMSSVAYAAPLAPGHAAGVKKAEAFDMSQKTVLWVVGAGIVIGGIALVSSGSHGGNNGVVCTGTPSASGGCVLPPPPATGTGGTSGT